MSVDFMGTIPRFKGDKAQWKHLIDDYDIHKWVIGIEKGKDGLRHLQIRIRMRDGKDDHDRNAFEVLKYYFPSGHFEPCSDTWHYEKKDGHYWSSEDTIEVRKQRFGHPRGWQKTCVNALRTQNDRQIDVMYDPVGNMGKSWLVGHLFETGKAHYIPPYCSTIEKLVQTTASLFIKQGWRDYLIIDIPRAYKWSEQLYTAIESIKDGIIMETRYEAQPINIRGVKIVIMCNELPKLGKLSIDRWRIATLS